MLPPGAGFSMKVRVGREAGMNIGCLKRIAPTRIGYVSWQGFVP